jgi:hypothetical protein
MNLDLAAAASDVLCCLCAQIGPVPSDISCDCVYEYLANLEETIIEVHYEAESSRMGITWLLGAIASGVWFGVGCWIWTRMRRAQPSSWGGGA